MSNCCAETKQSRICSDALKYVEKQLAGPPKKAILSCEGGCIKGEIARTAANYLAYRLAKESAVRICLGDASTGNSGMLKLIKKASEIIAVEGCPLQCGTEIMKFRLSEINPTIIDASALYQYDREKYFEILDMPRDEVEELGEQVAKLIYDKYLSK